MMTIKLRALALLLLSVLLSGCFFSNPLTPDPSEDINTWLLGVWEHTDDKGKVFRAGVLPLAVDRGVPQLATADRYTIWFRALGKRPSDTKEWQFEAWASRVGSANFLTLKCIKSAGELPENAYTFIHPQVLNQTDVVIRTLQLDSGPEATSFELRKEIRTKLKNRTLYPETGSVWTRVAEVYWKPGDEGEGSFVPVRFPED